MGQHSSRTAEGCHPAKAGRRARSGSGWTRDQPCHPGAPPLEDETAGPDEKVARRDPAVRVALSESQPTRSRSPRSPGPVSATSPLKFHSLFDCIREHNPRWRRGHFTTSFPSVHGPHHCGQDEKQRPCCEGDRPHPPSPDPPRTRREGRSLEAPDPGPRPVLRRHPPNQQHRRRLAVEQRDAHAGRFSGRPARPSTAIRLTLIQARGRPTHGPGVGRAPCVRWSSRAPGHRPGQESTGGGTSSVRFLFPSHRPRRVRSLPLRNRCHSMRDSHRAGQVRSLTAEIRSPQWPHDVMTSPNKACFPSNH